VKIQLAGLPQGHSDIVRDVPAERFELGEWLHARGPVQVELDADRRGEQITFNGAVRVEGDAECARCLAPFVVALEAEVLLLADLRGSDELVDEAALEEDGSVLYHDGLELDLTAALREAIILEVPVVHVCRPDCRGLCPQCGQDLNVGPCSCTPARGDSRWGALKGLKSKPS
jgi:uncharacterized protein